MKSVINAVHSLVTSFFMTMLNSFLCLTVKVKCDFLSKAKLAQPIICNISYVDFRAFSAQCFIFEKFLVSFSKRKQTQRRCIFSVFISFLQYFYFALKTLNSFIVDLLGLIHQFRGYVVGCVHRYSFSNQICHEFSKQ